MSKNFQSINPYNNQVLAEYKELSEGKINANIAKSNTAFEEWRGWSFAQRAEVMTKAAQILKKNVDKYAETISLEMGKPINEARSEVNKCAWVCEYYAQKAEGFLSSKSIETDAHESFVTYEPLGTILAIMPWNFPFWQVFRFAAPTLMAGNVGMLKHAGNVYGSAVHIEEIFKEAGAPDGVFQSLVVHHDKIARILENPIVKAVTLTGSEKAGASVAAAAGKNIKKSLLELGGSNAFVVLADADIAKAAEVAVNARFMNAGQSCIAAKRFIVLEDVYEVFLKKFTTKVSSLKSGDPMAEDTKIGTLAKSDFVETLKKQMDDSIKMGAKLALGGASKGAYFEPTILTEVTTDMPVFQEETFGPIAPICKVKTVEEAFTIAKNTTFGLGISVFTQDLKKVKDYIKLVPDGAFFVNELVKSDPRLPFGGTGNSGFGRELSREGILEFVNVKTVYIK
ncbi:succinate-semialdehyde dehydrogenase / glutarate-semialdehyde dehydrogenase [Spirosomataceae bacterium TFI 002]|nr:succinate-semialdehyde dehydrogenase / glutarate-semialdehyde dehydrogenase [Spirosomataceae bacterium TFI 002]